MGLVPALAEALAAQQMHLLLTARRADRLQDLASTLGNARSVHVLAGDVAVAAHREALLAHAREQLGGLDVLINNAGVGGIGSFASADAGRLRQIMEVNFFAPAELLRGALPLLAESADPLVVNVGSVLGHFAVPKKAEYCASKFALHGLTDALRMELGQVGIDVLLVSPSTTSSEFFARALRSKGQAASTGRAMTPAAVAQHAVRAMRARQREVILSWGGNFMVWADRLVPDIVSRLLGRFG